MGRICSIAAAILALTFSCAWAGTFEALADAQAAGAPTPLYARPGMVVKAEFKSHLPGKSEMQTESDTLLPEPREAPSGPSVTPRPAVAYKKRSVRAMAPPPGANPSGEHSTGRIAQAKEQADDLELDLEKDLVISPPPPKTNEGTAPGGEPTVETRGTQDTKSAAQVKKKRARPGKRVRKRAPAKEGQFAASPRSVRKVRPLSRNAWAYPAGSHGANHYPMEGNAVTERTIVPPPTTARYRRNGVTVKLAPKPVPAFYSDTGGEFIGSDVVAAAVEIIGMPFALIGSLF